MLSAGRWSLLTVAAVLFVNSSRGGALGVSIPSSATEGSPNITGFITADSVPASNVTVTITSSDPSQVIVSPNVILPIGQTSAEFTLVIVNDSNVDFDQTITVTAQAPGWTSGSANIVVRDNEPTNLVVTLPRSVREGDGTVAGGGSVNAAGAVRVNTLVTLTSSDPTALTVPASVTIPAGQAKVTFNFTVVDDPQIDGAQTAIVTASASGFTNGVASVIVFDDESPPEPTEPSPANLASNVIQTIALSWTSHEFSGGRTYSNDVYFGTSPTPGPSEFLGNTLGTNWALPLLFPATTYYWQIVAREAGTTLSPVWRFTTRGVDHFIWEAIPPTQYVSEPFAATITAKDSYGSTVSNFTGTVVFSSDPPTNTILRDLLVNPSPNYYAVCNSGFEFTPNVDLTVTHVRSVFGTKVSIWTASGTLLVSQNVSGVLGAWTDTPLPGPVMLTAGTKYRIGVYTASPTLYNSCCAHFTFEHGSVEGAYYSQGDNFPTNSDQYGSFPLCDIRYVKGLVLGTYVPIAPTHSGAFLNGTWTGGLTALAPGTNVIVRAFDDMGHLAFSNRFEFRLRNDLVPTVADSPDPVTLGGDVTYTITVTNIGPNNANGVTLTNVLAPGAGFISVNPSQGTVTNIANLVVCDLGDLAGDASATVTIVATTPTVSPFTNQVFVARADADAYLANNSAVAVTSLTTPVIRINDVPLTEGDVDTTANFTLSVSPPTGSPISVNFSTASGTAVSPTDFIGTNGIVTFEKGETNKTLAISVAGDLLYEANESFTVNLSSPTNATIADAQGVATLLNDDPMPSVSIGDVTLWEGDMGTTNAVFSISLSAPSGMSTTVNFATTNGSAIAGSDYTAYSGTANLPAGVTNTSISVAVAGDLLMEPDEVFLVRLSNPVNAVLLKAEGVGSIINDDGLPGNLDHFVWETITSAQPAAKPFSVTVNALDAFNQPATNFNGLAYFSARVGSGTNVLPANTTGTFTNGTWSGTLTVPAPANNLVASAQDSPGHHGESNPFNVIYLDDLSIKITATPALVGVGGTITYSLTVTNVGPAAATSVVITNVLASTAMFVSAVTSQGSGFTNGPEVICDLGTLPGDTAATITIVAQTTVPGSITNRATVYRGETDSSVTNNSVQVVTAAQIPQLTINNTSLNEGNSGFTQAIFTVSLTPPPSMGVQVSFTSSNGTALAESDYLGTNGILNFSIGQTTLTIPVSIIGDTNIEPNETFSMILSAASNATIVVATGNATILDDDLGPFFDDFETTIDLNQWSAFGGVVGSTVLATNYGGSVSGSNSLWFGAATNRFAATRSLDTLTGGAIQFYLRLAFGTNIGTWETIESSSKGIVLEYSTVNTNSWTPISSYGFNAATNSNWNWYYVNIPTAAKTASTRFRWRQLSHGGACCDHWALDDVKVLIGPQPPLITVQPTNRTVSAGQLISFNTAAVGTAPFTYQWFKELSPLVDQTNATLTLLTAQTNDAGNYRVVVSNPSGSATSSPAMLTVLLPTPCASPVSGIVSWWAAEGNAGDVSKRNPGVLSNATFAVGKVGQAFKLNGANAYILVAASSNLNVGTVSGLTIEGWIKPESLSQQQAMVEWNDGVGGVGVHFWGSYPSAGALYGNIRDTNNSDHTLSTAANVLNTNNYQHVALSYDHSNGVARIYYNGDQIASRSVGVFSPRTAYPLYFGTRVSGGSSGSYFRGFMDEFTLYNRALSPAEIAAIFQASLNGKCTSALAPFIVSPPADLTAVEGDTVTFDVIAEGVSPKQFWWRKDLAPLANQSGSALVLSNVRTNDAGTYSVIASNEFGSAISSNATLIVTPRPVIFPDAHISTNGVFEFRVRSAAGTLVVIEASTNLCEWISIQTNLIDSSELFRFQDSNTPNFTQQFFRARLY